MGASSPTFVFGNLLPVAVSSLCLSESLPFDLYVPQGEAATPRLYRRRDYPLSGEDLRRLLDRGIHTLYIMTADSKAYREHLLKSMFQDESVPPLERYQSLRATASAVLADVLRNKDVEGVVEVTGNLADKLVVAVCENSVLLFELFEVMAHDYTTFTHMLNVSTYAVLLAHRFGIRDTQDLIGIGKGAMLHDIGKLEVPAETLTKREKLTRGEVHLLRQHPTRGFRKLAWNETLSWGQLMMVYQHHERCDGRGYPAGLVGREIHLWARLCAVADVFDALTHERHYRNASPFGEALEYFDVQAGRAFDEEMVHCLIATVKQQQI